jgi:hypothetical protein
VARNTLTTTDKAGDAPGIVHVASAGSSALYSFDALGY